MTAGRPAGAPSADANRGIARRGSLPAASAYREGGPWLVYSGRQDLATVGRLTGCHSLSKCSSRVRGNLHARFLGGGGRVTVSCYPACPVSFDVSRRRIASRVAIVYDHSTRWLCLRSRRCRRRPRRPDRARWRGIPAPGLGGLVSISASSGNRDQSAREPSLDFHGPRLA